MTSRLFLMYFQNILFILSEMQFPRLQKMLLVSHKTGFYEKEAAYLCVTTRKRGSATRVIICYIKFWHRYHIVENTFLWQELQVAIT